MPGRSVGAPPSRFQIWLPDFELRITALLPSGENLGEVAGSSGPRLARLGLPSP